MNTIKLDSGRVQMIAHRGLSGLERENTCAAFVAAGNREKYYGIETDVHRTKDGYFIVFHDDDTARVGLDSLTLEESTFQTLSRLQLTDMDGLRGRRDLVIPTLEDYIGICKRYEKVAVLELKNEFEPEDIYQVMAVFERMDYLDHATIISFQPNNLVALRKRYPQVSAQFLLREFPPEAMDFLRENNLGLDIRYNFVTKELVDQVHAMGLPVNCWTVNTLEDAQDVMDKGVDFITTNILE